MVKLVLTIRSLDIGGAERQFIELVKNINKNKFDILVCSMYGGIQENIVKNIPNIRYVNLEKKGRYDFKFYQKYKNLLNEFNPNVIYSFLGEMNLFSYWAKPKHTKLIWGFRASNIDMKKYGKLSQFLFWLQKIYSKKVDKIITNSYASVEFHKKVGFDMSKAVVIHNGIDTNKFKKNDKYRKEFRNRYNLSEGDIAIGIVARIDAMKGYPVLVKSMKKIFKEYKNVKFFAVGDGDKNIKKECEKILGNYSNSQWIWLGKRDDVEKIYSGLDIYVSSSLSEGFSNSIAEAMACEVPCVVTNVGDSKIIIADCGIIVKSNNVDELYKGIKKMINSNIKELGKNSRKRIMNNFSIQNLVKNTEKEIIKCAE